MPIKLPQTPMLTGANEPFYPLTHASQVIKTDGSRLEQDGKINADQASTADKLGGKAPEYYIQPRNLLDNSDFTNPVNQRNFTSTTTAWSMTIDRWMKGDVGQARVVHDAPFGTAFAIDGAFVSQRVGTGFKAGVTYTFAVNYYFNNGTISLSNKLTDVALFPESVSTDPSGTLLLVFTPVEDMDPVINGDTFLRIAASDTVGIKWAALYEGAYTADTLPPYVPKGYTQELEECHRYFLRCDAAVFAGRGISTTQCMAYIPTTIKMRINPTIVNLNGSMIGFCCVGGGYYYTNDTTEIEHHLNESGVYIKFNVPNAKFVANEPVNVDCVGYCMDLSADL